MDVETGDLLHIPLDAQKVHSDTFLLMSQDLGSMGLPLGPSFDEDNDARHPKSILMPCKINRQTDVPRYQTAKLSEEKDEDISDSETPMSPPRSRPQSPVVEYHHVSVKELDLRQRKRREERERKHSNLQYKALMERLKKRDQSEEAQSRLRGFISQDSSTFGLPVTPAFRMKPIRRVSDGGPILILPQEQSVDRLNDIFESPNSNKFFLQFPCDPSQELHIDDLKEADYSSIDGSLDNSTTVRNDDGSSTRDSWLHKINSIGIFNTPDDCLDHQDSTFIESSNASLNLKRNIIMLKPKTSYSHESQKSSPCSASSSNVEGETRVKPTRYCDSVFTSIDNANESLNRRVDHASQSTYVSLRPKKRFIISSTPVSFTDENDASTDSIRDFNRSRSFSSSKDGPEYDDLYITNVRTPSHRRHSSVSFQNPVPAYRDGNALKGKQSAPKQIYEGDENIDRLTMPPPMGLTRANSCCTAASEDIVLSPSLSESNFRTPNPESVRRRYWFGAPTPVQRSPMADSADRRGSLGSTVGLFLPRLFASNLEEEVEEEDLCIGQKNVSTSFFERVRDAFSS